MALRFIAVYLAFTLGALAQQPTLGTIDFPTSGSPEAQKHFLQGVLLLHSFEYVDAIEEFQSASKLEPGFAMAYWGEALAYTHPVWVEQDASAGRAALAKLAPTPELRLAKAPTDREKGYLQAVEKLYGEGSKVTRDVAYAEAMDALRKKYPEDLEAASLYAVALLGTCQYERQYPVYMRAAAVAEEVFAKNPQHPGAIHYLIHAYDDPVHAPLGLRAAQVYGKVAGSASHAQHMPSHIFFALGMWDEAIAANEASVAVADERLKRKGLGTDKRNYHALLWLEYAYLQEGRYKDARRLLADSEGLAAQSKTASPQSALARMRSTYALETGESANLTGQFDLSKANGLQSSAVLTAQGLSAIRNGHLEEARRLYADAQRRLNSNTNSGMTDSHHGGLPSNASPENDKLAHIMNRQLEAELLFSEGKRDEALDLLAATATEEDSLTFEFGPPVPLKPAHELYGEMLLAAGRPKEAEEQFQKALARAPGRAVALRDLAKAAAASGDSATSLKAQNRLNSFWRGDEAR